MGVPTANVADLYDQTADAAYAAGNHDQARKYYVSAEQYADAAQIAFNNIGKTAPASASASDYQSHTANPPDFSVDPSWSYMGLNSSGLGGAPARADSTGKILIDSVGPNYCYLTLSGLGMGLSLAQNNDTGDLYLGGGPALPVPGKIAPPAGGSSVIPYSTWGLDLKSPSGGIICGFINDNVANPNIVDRGEQTGSFLEGGAVAGGGGAYGLYGGFNHAMGGATAVEVGVATPGGGVTLGLMTKVYTSPTPTWSHDWVFTH